MLRRPSKPLAKKASIAPVEMVVLTKEEAGARLDRWFKRHMPDIPFGLVSRWVRTGQVRVDGGRAKVGDHIAQGQELRVPPAEPPSDGACVVSGF